MAVRKERKKQKKRVHGAFIECALFILSSYVFSFYRAHRARLQKSVLTVGADGGRACIDLTVILVHILNLFPIQALLELGLEVLQEFLFARHSFRPRQIEELPCLSHVARVNKV